MTATATIIKLLGGQIGISYEMGALIATAIFIIYTAASGLFGVVYTDVVQFFMLIIFVYIMIPTASLDFLGGFGNFWANLDKSYITPHINGEILGDIVTYLVFTMAGAEMWQRGLCRQDPQGCPPGHVLGDVRIRRHHCPALFDGACRPADPAQRGGGIRHRRRRGSGAGHQGSCPRASPDLPSPVFCR